MDRYQIKPEPSDGLSWFHPGRLVRRKNARGDSSNLVIMHIALQGCLKAGAIPYGLTADTGGHIRYLLELVHALSELPEVSHQILVTRAFDAPDLGEEYREPEERLSEKVTIWRCQGNSSAYLPKEALWRELPKLTEVLLGRIRQEGVQPDLVHAHYADAGVMAMRMKAALGVPYVFTAHSLGATKAQHQPEERVSRELRRRIRYEELALSHADRVIASSDHEARVQYGLYRRHEAARIRVNPPGCNFQSFRAPAPAHVAERVDGELRRFLRRPERPCLLAIARPVEKKNLRALIMAYGENPGLRAKANLVIYAGPNRELMSGEPEARRVWQDLLQLIDRYDLYGDVAYPKQHEVGDVPAVYQWAARRRGVFVNPALNEPFGLTLLEAAAAGLPVVATRFGGPVDIVNHCQHGRLVAPTDTSAIARACHDLLANELDWQRHASNGKRGVNFYTWARHVHRYLADMFGSEPALTARRSVRPVTRMLVTDMDGTLLGHWQGLKRLSHWLERNRQCLFVVATGRGVTEALRQLAAWGAPRPDFLITDVGSTIYQLDPHGQPHLLPGWHRHLDHGWHRAACEQLLDASAALVPQPDATQSAYKLSYFTRPAGDRPPEVEGEGATATATDGAPLDKAIARRLVSAGLEARVVHSHGHLLDILPARSGKAGAAEFLRQRFNIDHEDVVAAGDSGNDADLLEYAALGIAVANHSAELERLRSCPTLYWAKSESAAGILEGLEHWHQRHPAVTGADTTKPGAQYLPPASEQKSSTPARPGLESGSRGMEAGI